MIKLLLCILITVGLNCISLIAISQNKPQIDYQLADSLFGLGKSVEAAPIFFELINGTISDSFKAESLMRYGLCQRDFDKVDSGIFYIKQASEKFQTQGNKVKLSRAYQNIGTLYLLKKNNPEAMAYYTQALTEAQLMKDSLKIYLSICVLHLKLKHFDTAYFIIRHNLASFPENSVPWQTFHIEHGLGVYFNSKKEYDSALFHLQIAAQSTTDVRFKANAFNTIAEAYKGLKNYPMALLYQDSSTATSGKDASVENLLLDYKTYAGLYKETNDYKNAYYYSDKGWNLSDSFFNAENSKAMVDAEAKYQNQKALADNALLEKNRAITQRNFVFSIIALSLVALLAFLAFRNTRIKQKANLLLTQQKQQVQQLADQLAVANDTKARLFSTIGHDLRSPVSSLYASLKMQELKGNAADGDMSEQTVRLLDTLEELLIWSKSQMDGFTIQPVKINVRYFFEDLKEFYSNAAEIKNIAIVNDVPKDVVIRTDENLLKTIFRNAISNAISNTQPGQSIHLTAQPAPNDGMCIAVNNPCDESSYQKFKTSFEDAVVKSGAYGLGIVLMKEFAQKLGGRIDLAYTQGHASLRLCI